MQFPTCHSLIKKLPSLSVSLLFAMATVTLISCGDESASPDSSAESKTTTTDVPTPPFTIVKSDIGGNDARYRVQVGDSLPNEEQAMALFKKIAHYEGGTATRNTSVYLTREGFAPLLDAHAHVSMSKGDEKPKYVIQTASNDRLKELAELSFDSIPNKTLIVEFLDAGGSKRGVYKKPSGGYLYVIMFGKDNYEVESIKLGKGHTADQIELVTTGDDDSFTYKEDETGTMLEVYTSEGKLYNAYKILKKG